MTDPHEYGSFPLRTFLEMEVETPEAGRGRARVHVDDRHRNPNGVVHGGVVFTLVDTSMGGAALSVLDPGEVPASIEVSLRFLRAVAAGELVVDTRVLRRGRRVVQLESEVRDGEGTLVATGAGSFAVIPTPSSPPPH